MSDIGFFRIGTEDYHIASDAVRTTAQSLSNTEKEQARANIGAGADADIPGVVDNLESDLATAALSANQGRVLNGKIPPVIDSLTSSETTSALSAKQGKVLNEKIPPVIDSLTSSETTSALSAKQGKVLKDLLGSLKVTWTSDGSFPGLVSNSGDCYLIVGQRLSVNNAIVLVVNNYNGTLYVAEIFKSANMSHISNSQGTVQLQYNGSGTGVLGAAFRLRAG